MAQYKITLIGLENYLNPERSLFDKLTLPDGIDKDTLIGSIVLRCQEFELLYSDPEFLIDAIDIWGRKNYRTFDKWVKALNIEYDPLYNYDRTEEYEDVHDGNFSREGSMDSSGSNTRTDNLTDTDNLTRTDNLANSTTPGTTVTHSEKAYNDTNFVETSKDAQTGSISGTNTGTVTNTGSVTHTGTQGTIYSDGVDNDESGSDHYKNTHTARLYGNIGVTTSQQMLTAELDVARWNMYEHIADLFANEFCIMVY